MEELNLESLIENETITETKKSSKKKNVKTETTETTENKSVKNRVDEASATAAATAALKAAIDANNRIASTNADREFLFGMRESMLNKCKTDPVVKFTGSKIYAQYFGSVYSFLYNTIPVTVKFDGSVQEFPLFIYEEIMNRIGTVSEQSTSKTVDEIIS